MIENGVVCGDEGRMIPVTMTSVPIGIRGNKYILVSLQEGTLFPAHRGSAGADHGERIQPDFLPRITARERQIIRLIAFGNTSKNIGTMLNISHRTVDSHRERIMQKLNLRKTADLVRLAITSGLLQE